MWLPLKFPISYTFNIDLILACFRCGCLLVDYRFLAAVLVKMLRMYHIFTKFKPLTGTAKYKDYILVLYVLLILSPNTIFHILWHTVDSHSFHEFFVERPGYIRVQIRCLSKHYWIWYLVISAYLNITVLVLVIIATISRKIRRANFKGTKKVN